MNSKYTTFLIKTFDRPALCQRLLDSINEIHPGAKVIVSDDSRKHTDFDFGSLDAIHQRHEYDIGLSEGRNRAVLACDTRYMVLLDDDMIMRPSSIERMQSRLRDLRCDIMCGHVQGYNRAHVFGRFREYQHEDLRGVSMVFGAQHKWTKRAVQADYGLNFFVAKTDSVKKVMWDPRIKIAHEHCDFFYRAAVAGLKVYSAPDCTIDHPKERRTRAYKQKRVVRKHRFQYAMLENMGADSFSHKRGRKFGHINNGRGVSFPWQKVEEGQWIFGQSV